MSLYLLAPVHYLPPDMRYPNECKLAYVEAIGESPDTADLSLSSFMSPLELCAMSMQELDTLYRRNVRFDVRGEPGTWHFADDCPIGRKAR